MRGLKSYAQLICILISSCIIVSIFLLSIKPAEETHSYHTISGSDKQVQQSAQSQTSTCPTVEDKRYINCIINGDYTIQCLRDSSDIFMPFTFIKTYFEVLGKVSKVGKTEQFEFSHAFTNVLYPRDKYSTHGAFLYFTNYNVEARSRVKFVEGHYGVPVSNQWEPKGHLYPIQICQFGLAHYSKYVTSSPPTVKSLLTQPEWLKGDAFVSAHSTSVIINTRDSSSGAVLSVSEKRLFILSLSVNAASTPSVDSKQSQPSSPNLHEVAGFVVSLLVNLPNGTVQPCTLQYSFRDANHLTKFDTAKFHFEYLLGSLQSFSDVEDTWRRITRDLHIDLTKGFLSAVKKRSASNPLGDLAKIRIKKVVSITFHGNFLVSNLTLSSSAHLSQFFDAVRWLMDNQNKKNGGWATGPARWAPSSKLRLDGNWYSAMGQGHAMSVLSRAFHLTREHRYLDAAVRATHLFDVNSSFGGVTATFMSKHIWYEEYPTTPSMFVLNGFIYSLFGLYDLMNVAQPNSSGYERARDLFLTGLKSLKALLPLFDSGSGSFYDLRHATVGSAPKLARAEYHLVHINQLLVLNTIAPDPIFSDTVSRWIGYTRGRRSPHN